MVKPACMSRWVPREKEVLSDRRTVRGRIVNALAESPMCVSVCIGSPRTVCIVLAKQEKKGKVLVQGW